MRMRKKKHTDDRLLACGELFCDAPTVRRGKWHELSQNRPIFLEIGCGKGTFICETARRHPENFYIAVEKVRDVLVMAIEKVKEAGLTNVVFSDADAEKLTDIFADGELCGLYLNFSDPWPKKRHASRRLTHSSFLKLYRKVLAPDGKVFFKTDNRPLFDFSLEEMRENGWALSDITYDLHNSEYQKDNIVTEYEATFSAKGFSINRVVAAPIRTEAQVREKAEPRKAYLFDLDGTLVDSMGKWAEKMLHILNEEKIDYPPDIINRITPLGDVGTAKLFSEMGVPGTVDEIITRMNDYAVPQYTYHIVTKPGVAEYLRKLKSENAILAVLTASPHCTTDVCLKRNGVYDLFDKVWSVSDLGMVKSQPEIYADAADRLGVPLSSLTFFDDNLIALTAAKKAGVFCVGVYDASSDEFSDRIRSMCDRYIRSFEELI